MTRLVLIDGSGFIYRAFYALPPLTRPSDNLPVGAVVGFCNMLWRFLEESPVGEVTHMAVVFDAGKHTFRNDIDPNYKAHRLSAPSDLTPQFSFIREAVAAFGVPAVEQAGFEADDLIASYATWGDAAETIIVSSDKDLMQLVGLNVTMFDPIKSRVIDTAAILDQFGVVPSQMVDVQALAGDAADNVPGVPGIGIKIAAELIRDYGDLETLLACAADIKQPKRRAALIAHAADAHLSRRLVTLRRDVPIGPLDELAVSPLNHDTLLAFCEKMEFKAFAQRVRRGTGEDIP